MTPRVYHNSDGSTIIREPDKYRDLLEAIDHLTYTLSDNQDNRRCLRELAWGLGMAGFSDVCEDIMKYAK